MPLGRNGGGSGDGRSAGGSGSSSVSGPGSSSPGRSANGSRPPTYSDSTAKEKSGNWFHDSFFCEAVRWVANAAEDVLELTKPAQDWIDPMQEWLYNAVKDSYIVRTLQQDARENPLGGLLLSVVADTAYDLLSFVLGHDIVTGEKLSHGEELLTFVAVFVPLVAAGAITKIDNAARTGSRLSRHAHELGEGVGFAAKHADELEDTARTATRHSDELLDSTAKRVCQGNSFTSGTPVETEDGPKPIEEIQEGDKVLAEDPETGEQGYFEVVALTNHPTDEILRITIEASDEDAAGEQEADGANKAEDDDSTETEQDVMEITPDHPVYVEEAGWLLAENLEEGDRLRRADGGLAKVLAIERVQLDEPESVYNFTVRGPHTYFVLDAEVLAHNTGACDLDDAGRRVARELGFSDTQIDVLYDNLQKNSKRSISIEIGKLPDGSLGLKPATKRGEGIFGYKPITIKDKTDDFGIVIKDGKVYLSDLDVVDIVDDGVLLNDRKSQNVIDELTDSWIKRTGIDDLEYSPFQHPGRATFYETSMPVHNLDARNKVAFVPPKRTAVFELDDAGNLRVTQRSGDDYLSNLLDRAHSSPLAQNHPWYPSTNTVDWEQYYFDRGTIRFNDLPQEAKDTSSLIDSNGPFPYDPDDTTFENKKSLLPPQTDPNYYKEYTVTTPGLSHRGKRRIVTGDNGTIRYYTDDHYKWFRRVLP